jgi:xylulose-5-phosphate/fructose-6-phosphate phosphoketolase
MDEASPQRPDAKPLDEALLRRMDLWWRAANYLSVGQIYLLANPLLRQTLAHEHVKRRLLGHFGTTPGLNFLWVHLNRLIRARDLNVIFIAGPGHGAPGVVASTWLEGSYSELYPAACRAGDARLDPRGRRARLFAVARVWRGVRQSGPAGRLRDR